MEVLKRMGMAYGLEKQNCSTDDLKKAIKMVPKSLEPYVLGVVTFFTINLLTLCLDFSKNYVLGF